MNDSFIKYVTCCKLWLEFHKDSNPAGLLRYKLTDKVYYKLLQEFNLISIRFNTLSNKELLDDNDFEIINNEVIKYNDFFDIMSIIKSVMEN
jgi:hypothetical protein